MTAEEEEEEEEEEEDEDDEDDDDEEEDEEDEEDEDEDEDEEEEATKGVDVDVASLVGTNGVRRGIKAGASGRPWQEPERRSKGTAGVGTSIADGRTGLVDSSSNMSKSMLRGAIV